MSSARRRITLVATTLAATALLAPVAADAATLKGQVVGTPYVVGSRAAVPVLFTAPTVKSAKLRSPVGIIKAQRALRSTLAIGDQFTATSKITKSQRKALYPNLVGSMRVTKKAKAISLTQIEATVRKLQADLTLTQQGLAALAGYTVSEIGKLRADLTALLAQLTTLKGQLGDLSGVLSTLTTTVSGLTTQLTGLLDQVTGLLTNVASLQSLIDTITDTLGLLDPAAIAGVLAQIPVLNSLVAGLLPQIGTMQTQLTGLLGVVGAGDAGLVGQIAGLQSTLGILCGLPIIGTAC